MKSHTIVSLASALTYAVSAITTPNTNSHDYLSYPYHLQIETRPPIIVVETVTKTKTWEPKKEKPYWNHNYKNEDKEEEEEEDEDENEDEEGPDWDKHKTGGHRYSPKASKHVDFVAAQASSVVSSMTSAAASRATSVASRTSSAASSASSSVSASSNGERVHVGGTFLVIAGVVFYWLL